MSSIVCLSHREDVDGILSAVLIKAALKAKQTQTILADYANILSKLQRISDMASISRNPLSGASGLNLGKLGVATNFSLASQTRTSSAIENASKNNYNKTKPQ